MTIYDAKESSFLGDLIGEREKKMNWNFVIFWEKNFPSGQHGEKFESNLEHIYSNALEILPGKCGNFVLASVC